MRQREVGRDPVSLALLVGDDQQNVRPAGPIGRDGWRSGHRRGRYRPSQCPGWGRVGQARACCSSGTASRPGTRKAAGKAAPTRRSATGGSARREKRRPPSSASRDLWSSDLARARRTAELLAPAGITVRLDERLRERDVGSWAGLTSAGIDERYPGWIAAGRRPPDWESDDALRGRCWPALRAIAASLATETWGAVVTHGGLIRVVAAALGVVAVADPEPEWRMARVRHRRARAGTARLAALRRWTHARRGGATRLIGHTAVRCRGASGR